MKIGEIVEGLQYFFLDIIGVIVPGITLIVGLGAILKIDNITVPFIPTTYQGIFLIFISYAAGHLVSGVGSFIFINLITKLASFIRKFQKLGKFVPKNIKSSQELITEICDDIRYKNFIEQLRKEPNYRHLVEKMDSKDFTYWRDIAMSIGSDERSIVYKFMFISLLSSGMGTALLLISLLWGILNWRNLFQGNILPLDWTVLVLSILASLFFFERGANFYGLSMRVPFPIATVKLLTRKPVDMSPQVDKENYQAHYQISYDKPSIYLAGGFRSGWQDILYKEIPFIDYYDPRSHKITNEYGYTFWDLEAIRKCDWVFAFFEKDNPGGYALALEIGYAKALNKKIILVDERSESAGDTRRHLGMLHASADMVFSTFQDAISFLKTMENVYK